MKRADNIREDHLAKREGLLKAGVELYPAGSPRTHTLGQILKDFDGLTDQNLLVAGRIRAVRLHGRAAFLDLKDASGRLQIFVSEANVGKILFDQLKEYYSEGDFIEVAGQTMVTKAGEPSLAAKNLRLLSKSLRSVPNDWFGLKDKEARFRRRYLDLLLNDETRAAFVTRSRLIMALRQFLNNAGFLEVETPILQTLPGGALARPFKTHLNALDLDLYLRVAPELYLKRLLVGGFEKVYELGRAFRNEGMDSSHNPEFTILEFYWAYQDREGLMGFTEKMISEVVAEVTGSTSLKVGDQMISFKPPWPRVGFVDLLKNQTGLDFDALDHEALLKAVKDLGLEIDPALDKGKIADELFKKKCRGHIIQPTFIIDHPIEISPLAKKASQNATRAARFQLVVCGNEYINAYNELNDPLEQAERFKAQERAAQAGDLETQPFDVDFIEALEYGMPPAAGWGLGVDRLAALLAGLGTLREVILFPTMRPLDLKS